MKTNKYDSHKLPRIFFRTIASLLITIVFFYRLILTTIGGNLFILWRKPPLKLKNVLSKPKSHRGINKLMKLILIILTTVVLTSWFNHRTDWDVAERSEIDKSSKLYDKDLISALSLMVEAKKSSERGPASNRDSYRNLNTDPPTTIKGEAVDDVPRNQETELLEEMTISEQDDTIFSQENFNNARRDEKENMIINLENEIDLLHDELSEKRKDREKGLIIDIDEIDSIELEIEGKTDKLEVFKEALNRP